MRSRLFKYFIVAALVVFLGFKSVYIKRLDEVNAKSELSDFDAKVFARTLYSEKLPLVIDSAVELNRLVTLLHTDPEETIKRYSHALAIGNICYFLVRGEGTIGRGTESGFMINVKGVDAKTRVSLGTEFIYGNAIRDASALVRLSDFNSTAEINSISEQLNDIVRSEVIPPFVAKAIEGTNVQFAGAIELNRKYMNLDSIEVVPIRLLVQQ